MRSDIKHLIEHYQLKPLPVEKTLFTSSYRSTSEFASGSPVGTAIIGLYCHEPLSVSMFHRLPVDEVWHFYAGDPLRLVLLYPDGSCKDIIMGNRPLEGHYVQFIVPAGVWQAGHMLNGGRYSLFGCTMAPGFTDDMFEGGLLDELIKSYPAREEDIRRFACHLDQTRMPRGFAQ